MLITTQEDRAKVKQYLHEALKAESRKAEEAAHIRDILATLKEQHDIDPKVARKTLAAMKKGNMPEIKEEHDNLSDLYDIVGGGVWSGLAGAEPDEAA